MLRVNSNQGFNIRLLPWDPAFGPLVRNAVTQSRFGRRATWLRRVGRVLVFLQPPPPPVARSRDSRVPEDPSLEEEPRKSFPYLYQVPPFVPAVEEPGHPCSCQAGLTVSQMSAEIGSNWEQPCVVTGSGVSEGPPPPHLLLFTHSYLVHDSLP